MKIAVDARELAGRPTGVGRYLSELIRRWALGADARRHEWLLYAHVRPPVPKKFAPVEVVAGNGGTRWEQWSFARALERTRPDVLFAPGYTAPLTAPCPTALTIHDVAFHAHPEWFAPREGARRRGLTAWSARRARVVLTDSAFSRDEIVNHIGVPAAKIRVVPLGMTPPPAASPRERRPTILFVGSIFRRRHVDRLIAAFAESVALRVPGSRLEIVGENRAYPPADLSRLVSAYPPAVQGRVTIRSYVDEATLADLYGEATVFAFPSEYEGFGLTPLEALAAGIPSVVLDTPIAHEVYGPAARYVDRDLSSHERLADALVDLLTHESARAAILRHASAVLARYDWNETAAATLRAIEEAAGV
jgi:glycosyltransferase involved in cell wall biosynthesis